MRRALLPLLLAGCQQRVALVDDVQRADTVLAIERPAVPDSHVRRVAALPRLNDAYGAIVTYDDDEAHVRCYVMTGETRGISCVKLGAGVP